MNGEVVVMGNWEKPNSSNSLVQKLQKEAQKMQKEKVEITTKSKSYEVENERLRKWRKLLESVQVEDVVQIRELEAIVAAATREKEYYAGLVNELEGQVNEILAVFQEHVRFIASKTFVFFHRILSFSILTFPAEKNKLVVIYK